MLKRAVVVLRLGECVHRLVGCIATEPLRFFKKFLFKTCRRDHQPTHAS